MRDVPYFPCYAANLIANRQYRLMSPIERGLWITLYLECWPNSMIPSDPKELSLYIGWSEADVLKGLTKNVLNFFKEKDGLLFNVELEEYRTEILARRAKQSEGGKKGAQIKKGRKVANSPEGLPEGSLSQVNLVQISSNQFIDKSDTTSHSEWLKDYESDSDDEYAKQSRGY